MCILGIFKCILPNFDVEMCINTQARVLVGSPALTFLSPLFQGAKLFFAPPPLFQCSPPTPRTK